MPACLVPHDWIGEYEVSSPCRARRGTGRIHDDKEMVVVGKAVNVIMAADLAGGSPVMSRPRVRTSREANIQAEG
ncbi:hypothetical protein FA13DRAFT_1743125 [Coprinellus micaceus]|uniref:Uncharacterized protein n=1 Tax=Coprinellus micaceus TaxID=71717 RepID=A0A4Y7SFB9_COPMI|nr:hypothetical protein FA13DRAFT_1743125 [Coprinellus micaceus]